MADDRSVGGYQLDAAHRRPEGVGDEVVAAVGKVSEAFEWVERIRGCMFELHQMMGRADFIFGDAADALEGAGCAEQSDLLRREVIGRNVLDGRWTFQMVEEFDDCYYEPTRAAEHRIRVELMGGRRHVFEAELKERRRTYGHPAHTRLPHRDERSTMSEQDQKGDAPGSPGVVGQQPNRFEDDDEIGPLDEAPDGTTPSDTTDSSEESLPPGA